MAVPVRRRCESSDDVNDDQDFSKHNLNLMGIFQILLG